MPYLSTNARSKARLLTLLCLSWLWGCQQDATPPGLVLTPLKVVLEEVAVGTQRSSEVRLCARGDARQGVTVSAVELRCRCGKEFDLGLGRKLPATLAPGQCLTANVSFKPREHDPGYIRDDLLITSDTTPTLLVVPVMASTLPQAR